MRLSFDTAGARDETLAPLAGLGRHLVVFPPHCSHLQDQASVSSVWAVASTQLAFLQDVRAKAAESCSLRLWPSDMGRVNQADPLKNHQIRSI